MTEKRIGSPEETPKPPQAQRLNSLLDTLRRQIPEPDLLAKRFHELYQDVMSPSHFPMPASETTLLEIDCETCQNIVDIYLIDELNGNQVKTAYPLIWDHLQACDRCQEFYASLEGLLEAQPASLSLFDSTTSRLPFLEPQPSEAAWITSLKSQLAGASFNLTFQFNRTYLQTLLLPRPLIPVRAENSILSSGPRLLLHQNVQVGEQNLTVDVTCSLALDNTNDLILQANLVGLQASPEQLWAFLIWANQTLAAPVDEKGQVDFGRVSLTALKEAIETGRGNFAITFAPGNQLDGTKAEGG